MIVHAKGGFNKQLMDLCKNGCYDILVMGSSKAHHDYIPHVFSNTMGMSCYNAGYDGNGIILAYGILNMIEDNRLPKLVIYDVKQQFDFFRYSGDGDYTRYYQIMKKFYGNPVANEIIRSISRNDLLKMHSGLYRYNGELLYTLSGFFRKSALNQDFGYEPKQGILTDDVAQEKDYSSEMDSLKVSYFKRFIDVIKQKGISLVVVFSPEYNTPFANDLQPVRLICEEKGVKVLDYFADSSFQNREYFIDHCHLNEHGAEIFSQRVVKDVCKYINIEDLKRN